MCDPSEETQLLAPPLPPMIFRNPAALALLHVAIGSAGNPINAKIEFAQLSFHGSSGMYINAEACVVGSLVGLQYAAGLKKFPPKSVPPTAMSNGVDAAPLIARPSRARVSVSKLSHPAEPPSPADTNALMPSAAACSHTAFQNWFPAVPRCSSHCPKLMLEIEAMLWSAKYCAESAMPSVVFVLEETIILIVAPLATAPDQVTSITASGSISGSIPGSGPTRTTSGSFTGRLKSARKLCMSDTLMFDSWMMAIVSPRPSIPVFHKGNTL